MERLVSVIIPVYNMGDYVRTCIDSVLNQTYKNFEIVIVNDGSKDNSEVVCAEIAKVHPCITLFTQENQGVSVARNKGLELAEGDYVLFVDADDIIPPNALKALTEAAEVHNYDMTIGRISPEEELPIGTFSGEEFLVKCLEDNPVAYYSVRTLYKREFLQGMTFKKGFISGEDSFFVFECALKKPKVVTIEECVYSYLVNPNSATRVAFSRKRYDSVCTLLDKKEEIISKDYPHLLDLFYHLKVKIQIMLLVNLAAVKGKRFKSEEKETLARFDELKKYFKADLPCSNASTYNMLVKYGYRKFKLYSRFRAFVRRILKR